MGQQEFDRVVRRRVVRRGVEVADCETDGLLPSVSDHVIWLIAEIILEMTLLDGEVGDESFDLFEGLGPWQDRKRRTRKILLERLMPELYLVVLKTMVVDGFAGDVQDSYALDDCLEPHIRVEARPRRGLLHQSVDFGDDAWRRPVLRLVATHCQREMAQIRNEIVAREEVAGLSLALFSDEHISGSVHDSILSDCRRALLFLVQANECIRNSILSFDS
mmetsp:Transcript_5082/g.15361  ORF Transcript_5082/g.15361 Transcript_5082/m.15361 type:complete len:219 (+) Transcript_5082:1564-2220(+)